MDGRKVRILKGRSSRFWRISSHKDARWDKSLESSDLQMRQGIECKEIGHLKIATFQMIPFLFFPQIWFCDPRLSLAFLFFIHHLKLVKCWNLKSDHVHFWQFFIFDCTLSLNKLLGSRSLTEYLRYGGVPTTFV